MQCATLQALAPVVKETRIERRRLGCRALSIAILCVAAFVCAAAYQFHSKRVHVREVRGRDDKDKDKASDPAVHSYFLLDRTGSMAGLANAVREGFSNFVTEQQKTTGRMWFTVAQFDSTDPFELLVESAEIHTASRQLERYEPRSTTPLYDAIANMIRHAELTSHGSDEVILVVFTDGAENASREATRESVFAQIEEKKKAGWSFVFLGANQDAYGAAGAIGYAAGSTSNVASTHAGYTSAWSYVSKAMLRQRVVRAQPAFTHADRIQQAANFFDSANARTSEGRATGSAKA